MQENQPPPKREVWEQWDWAWHVSSYASLIIMVAVVLNRKWLVGQLPLFLTLSALLALWNIPFVATRVSYWHDSLKYGLLYFLVGFLLWAALITMTEFAILLIAMFYPLIFTRFPIRWAVAILIAQAVAFFLLYALVYPSENLFLAFASVLGLLAIAILIGVFISALVGQSLERQRLLDELTETRASLLKAEREAGTLGERHRLARDIHDTLAQQFTSIVMHLSAARLGNSADIQERMQQAEQAARDGLAESRRIIWDMRPEQLEEATFVESIEGVAARWSVENKVRVKTAVTGSPTHLNPTSETALLRITQEALHNIKKHANAQNVTITISYMPNQLALDIADNGIGFNKARKGRGFGLKTMRERAEALGGSLTIETDAGEGTAVAVSLPI